MPSRRLWLLAASLSLLVLPRTSYAGRREAVQKAVAATVAVEWRAEGAGHQAPEQPANVRHLPLRAEAVGVPDPGQVAARVRWRRTAAIAVARRADLALASGVVVSANGLVVTLNQEPDGRYDVVFSDGRSLPARVVVDDRRSGLRLLKVDAADLPHLAVADSEAEIGDQVFAAFSTDRHDRAAAQGMVAARQETGVIDLDLAAGRMSAGGPVVNEQGGLVGILSGSPAPAGQTTGNSAVPLRDVRALLAAQQGENTVVVHRGFLGVQLEGKPEGGRERVLVRLLADSPAQAAGMLDGDELLKVAGERITSMAHAAAAVARHSPGEKISVIVLREGQEKPLEILVGQHPVRLDAAPNPGAALRAPGGGAAVRAAIVRPEKLYVLSEDGKQVVEVADPEQVEALRQTATQALRVRALPRAPEGTIRVERSDLDKKLEEVGHSVESLQQQIQKLTAEIQALRSKLSEGK